MNRPHKQSSLWTVGQAIEAQFDAMYRDMSHVTQRQLRVYNQIVAMTRMLPKKEARP